MIEVFLCSLLFRSCFFESKSYQQRNKRSFYLSNHYELAYIYHFLLYFSSAKELEHFFTKQTEKALDQNNKIIPLINKIQCSLKTWNEFYQGPHTIISKNSTNKSTKELSTLHSWEEFYEDAKHETEENTKFNFYIYLLLFVIQEIAIQTQFRMVISIFNHVIYHIIL